MRNQLANLVLAFHVMWIALLIALPALSVKIPSLRPLKSAIFISTITAQLMTLGCPLTLLEFSLRDTPPGKLSGSLVASCLHDYAGLTVRPLSLTLILAAWFLIWLLVSLRLQHAPERK